MNCSTNGAGTGTQAGSRGTERMQMNEESTGSDLVPDSPNPGAAGVEVR